MRLTKYLALPKEMTPFEQRYLTRLNKVALIFFYLHIPTLMAVAWVAWVAGTGVLSALLLSVAVMVGPTIAACYISREFFDNIIGLEKIVEARAATIREKQRDMRLILDNVETGLVTVDLDGRLSSECSRAVEKWFGAPVAGTKLAAWLGARDASFGEGFDLALDGVRDGILPPEVSLSQLPKLLKSEDRTYAVSYRLIASADATPEKLLVIVTDITERLRTQAAERHHAELLQLFQHIMRDKSGFLEFLAEAEDLMRSLDDDQQRGTHNDLEHVKRLLHMLKGNAAIFGMRRLSELCNELEDHIAEESRAPSGAEMAALQEAWAQTCADVDTLIGEHPHSSIEIDDADYRAIIKAVLGGAEPRVVVRLMESWRLEPAGKRLARIERQIKGLAERMGKSNVAVAIAPHGLRFNTERFAPFWSAFIHVLRNAVDHGIEDRELRARRGKPAQSLIKVSTSVEHKRFIVTVEDDGPGVDWEALRAKAGVLGINAAALENKENLAFLPGVSSKSSVTRLSGRGIGMAAVRDACEALGGSVEIKSQPGIGTRVSFAFPKDMAVYEGHAATLREAALLEAVA